MIDKLINEYLKIDEIQRKESKCLYINPRLDRIRRKLEILKIVPLAEKGEVVFYNFEAHRELRW